jgi:hypothetical protein
MSLDEIMELVSHVSVSDDDQDASRIDEVRTAVAQYGRACYEQGYRKGSLVGRYDDDADDDEWVD